jgi:ribosomal protein S18 acetylase RimI-like enzyme
VEVRRATKADAEVLERLWREFTAEATFTPYPGVPFDVAFVTDHVSLLAEDEGEVVGVVYANVSSQYFGYVFGLYSCPSARRRGVATTLMRSIANLLRAEGRTYVVLSVDTPNEPARLFYDRLGFVDAARTLRVGVDSLSGGDDPELDA